MSRRRVDRDFFITHCGNWLPENRHVCLGLLRLELKETIEFYVDGEKFIIKHNLRNEERVFGGEKNGRDRSKA